MLKRFGKINVFNKTGPWRLILLLFSAAIFLMLIYCAWFYFSLPDVSYLKTKNPKTTALIEMRLQQARTAGEKLAIRQKWVRFSRIPKQLKQSIRITEDASFYRHEGVDFTELKESFKKNIKEGRLARGGSTITQQLAKNLYLSTEKSFLRKIREYFIARRLENTLSKNRIFHLYLNVIEFGPGIFGVQAASLHYFGNDVSRLSLAQIVRLTAVIPRPLITNPRGNSRWLKWKCRWILDKMHLYKYITTEQHGATLPEFN